MNSRPRPAARRLAPAGLLLTVWVSVGGTPATAQSRERALEHHRAGRFEEALAEYRLIIETYSESDPALAAQAHTNSCLIFMNQGDNERAIAACEEGLRLRRLGDDEPLLALTLNNFGLVLQNLGRYDDSEAAYREALAINLRIGALEYACQNLGNLSGVAIQAGRYAEALADIAEVRRLADEHPDAPWAPAQRRVAAINEGVVLEKLGAFRDALESFRLALAEEERIDDRLQAILRVNMGVIYRNLGDPLRAVELFEQAAATYRRLEDLSGLSNARLNTALAYHLNLERPVEAEAAYREALELAVESGDRPEEIQDRFYLGSLLIEQGRANESAEMFTLSLGVAEESGSAEGRWSSLAGLGRAAAAEGRLDEAMIHFEEALGVIDGVRADLTAETHRADFFGDKRGVYAAALQAAAGIAAREPSAENDRRAFHLGQRAKARELLDALGESGGHLPELREIATELDGRVLVEYFVAERDLLRWTLAGDGEPRMANLGPAAPTLARALRAHRTLAGGAAPEAEDLAALSTTLLGGVDTASPAALLISPDGALRYLPFALLPAIDERPGSTLLLDRATIEYLPSASVLAGLERGAREPELRTVALANPVFASTGEAARPTALLATRFGLDDLPATEAELASIERWLPGPSRRLSGAEATEAAFRELAAAGSRVVHLATHAVIDERPGRGAAVLLAADGDDDGLLYPQEIAALDLAVDLTVLAACRTALGEDDRGGSIATLTGAFLAAGSRGVVATLWEVGDRATAAFMDQFYWHLGRGASPAEALRLAKLRLRQDPEWRAPHLWSGYVLAGSPPELASTGTPRCLLVAAALVLLGLLGLALVARRRLAARR